jgi:Xaa-Pro aminopeptidase
VIDHADVYAARRARVFAALAVPADTARPGDGPPPGPPAGSPTGPAALVVGAAPELKVAGTELRYLPDADLFYLTGYTEPEAVLVLCPAATPPYTLFVRDRDPERERWTGVRGGIAAARDQYGADAAYPIAELPARLPKLLADATSVYARIDSGRPDLDMALRAALAAVRGSRPRTGRGPDTVIDPVALLGPMRRRKDAHELTLIRAAAQLTADAFAATVPVIRNARGEWEVEAALEHEFRRRGASGPAFPSIVAAGANATVLHYISNETAIGAGDMLLIDAGARTGMYCGDITRCYPASGRFTDVQRAGYDVVLRAHDAALQAAVPGSDCGAVHDAAVRVLTAGMVDLGLLDGAVDDLIAGGDYKRYYPHRTSHWLGLDVHDAGDYVAGDGSPITLQPGMVLTIEPGLYIPADDDGAPAALRGLGIRLEDDILITDEGRDVLTAALAIDADEVMAALAAG